ncbi:uncharacterized protein BO88DRAFT_378973 [Aspergillus vadensis CBS 113365]|uniref:Uncharacterized protein n=1 Tax=Aspergillus vadensis (strain CBS 113365 / IMI 142717 / IBT 24658) TaxID=1448311 RepID=A0A319D4S7_ASPVC|nr:hypothetical protein BO88DRAFT_378973 [Aspergillus vadensis CBS 113365]PYH75052.1 hypothetical protein BO88DRAFT_378973 [Aspergillus vadensis CBS 113365]
MSILDSLRWLTDWTPYGPKCRSSSKHVFSYSHYGGVRRQYIICRNAPSITTQTHKQSINGEFTSLLPLIFRLHTFISKPKYIITMQLLSILPIAALAGTSLAVHWNVTLYTDTECTEYKWSYAGNQSYGCYSLETYNPTIQSIRAEIPEDWVFDGASGGACNDFHTFGGSGCWAQGQGFKSFQVYPQAS